MVPHRLTEAMTMRSVDGTTRAASSAANQTAQGLLETDAKNQKFRSGREHCFMGDSRLGTERETVDSVEAGLF